MLGYFDQVVDKSYIQGFCETKRPGNQSVLGNEAICYCRAVNGPAESANLDFGVFYLFHHPFALSIMCELQITLRKGAKRCPKVRALGQPRFHQGQGQNGLELSNI